MVTLKWKEKIRLSQNALRYNKINIRIFLKLLLLEPNIKQSQEQNKMLDQVDLIHFLLLKPRLNQLMVSKRNRNSI